MRTPELRKIIKMINSLLMDDVTQLSASLISSQFAETERSMQECCGGKNKEGQIFVTCMYLLLSIGYIVICVVLSFRFIFWSNGLIVGNKGVDFSDSSSLCNYS